jgi:hypothetical protein
MTQFEPKQRGTGFDAYKIYTAIKLHFDSDSYDYFKYNGSIRATENSFHKRNDVYFFEKLARDYDLNTIIGKNLAQVRMAGGGTNKYWIKDLLSRENDKEYFRWKAYTDSFGIYLKNELSEIREFLILNEDMNFPKLFVPIENSDPIFLKWMITRKHTEECVLSIQKAMKCFEVMGLPENSIHSDLYNYYNKYLPFVENFIISRKEIQNLMIDLFKGV